MSESWERYIRQLRTFQRQHIQQQGEEGTLRADWVPATITSPDMSISPVPASADGDGTMWDVSNRCAGWRTVVADRGFTEGVHYFEVKVMRGCNFMISLLFPQDEGVITESNLASHVGAVGNSLLSQHCAGFYSGVETMGPGVRNRLDVGLDEPMAQCRDTLLAAGMTVENYNVLAQDHVELYFVSSNLHTTTYMTTKTFILNGAHAYCYGPHYHRAIHKANPPEYPHALWDWSGCRAGLHVDLQRGELHLLVYHADNPSRSYDAANKRVLLGTLPHGQQGRRCFPAVSVQGSEGALVLRTATRLPSGHPDLLEQLQDAAATAGDYRALMTEMGEVIDRQRRHLQFQDAQLQEVGAQLQEQGVRLHDMGVQLLGKDREIAQLRAELIRLRAVL